MTRVYADRIEVEAADGVPAAFGRPGAGPDGRFAVLRVLEHWIVAPEWWRMEAAEPGRADAGTPDGPVEYWRVEAVRGRSAAVYELRHEASEGSWLLTRVWA
ncbi:DUF6504 family protein [Actinomadura atramentaria]|uniref:DUF6504 family protein n=1 Tax=Actinomadura atramentaria TaxID=1990 RepID=UPI00037666BB|nr:DUF6504 family protein [Actinomadura atramentaria]